MMLQRRHPEHPDRLAGPDPRYLEHADLDHHRQRDDHEQAAQDRQQQLGSGHDRQAGQGAAEAERADVAHEDLGRGRVPPQEAEARAEHRARDHRQVQRVAHVIAVLRQRGGALVAQLPVADDHVGGQHRDRRPGGQAVQAVNQVHPVGGAAGHQDHPDHEEHRADGDAEVGQERQVGGRGGQVVAVRIVQRQDAERRPHHDLPDQLLPRPQPEAALPEDLDEVVDEPDQPHAGHQEQHQQPGRGQRIGREQMPGQISDQRRQDDHDAAHRGRAALGRVPGRRQLVLDLLAEAAAGEEADRDRGAEQRNRHRHHAGQQEGSQRPA